MWGSDVMDGDFFHGEKWLITCIGEELAESTVVSCQDAIQETENN